MNIEELIHDLRARINPQYYDQIGTESYERHQCVMAIESLLARNEVLRKVNEINRFDTSAMNQSLDLLREENDRLRVQLAGCGVAAMQNTADSRKDRIKSGDYGWSASYSDVCGAVDREIALREENERLRKDAAVSAAIERAAKDLPDGDMLEITVEKDSAMVVLYWGQGGFETMDVDDDNRLAAEINAAIDSARGAK